MVDVAQSIQDLSDKDKEKLIEAFESDFIGSWYDRAMYAIETVCGPQMLDIRTEMKKRD